MARLPPFRSRASKVSLSSLRRLHLHLDGPYALQPDTELNSQPVYNALSVTYRVCFKFVSSRDDRTICECGRPRNHPHHDRTESTPWTTERNTVPICPAPTGKLINGALVCQDISHTMFYEGFVFLLDLVRSSGLGYARE
jgi:CDGSH-type Zn-finger protein